jgi:hypothetical protein
VPYTVPSDALRYVQGAGPDEARVACQPLPGSDPNAPTVVFLANCVAMGVLLEMMNTAIDHAPDDDTRVGWRHAVLQFTSAIQGVITS